MEQPQRILVIDQQSSAIGTSLCGLLMSEGQFHCEQDNWDSFSTENLKQNTAELIAAVAPPTVSKTTDFFSWLSTHQSSTPVLAVLPEDPNNEFLRFAASASDDFIVCPLRKHELYRRIARILGEVESEAKSAYERLTQVAGLEQIVGAAPCFLKAVEQIPLIAKSDVTVLIAGETGTGKELCARLIHHLSSRRGYPFVAVDCSALPDHLFENELFGHVRGAYTDARMDQKGLAAMAEGGTLFLDEVDSLSHAAQAKLLRFLQEHSYKPLGADRFVQANVSVIAATNADLEACVQQKLFRSDLYFRLNVVRLELPSLRERRQDIELLARHFTQAACSKGGCLRKSLSVAALRKLLSHDWPGNVRELSNVIQRAGVFCEGPQILPEHIRFSSSTQIPESFTGAFHKAKAKAIETFERFHVEQLLHRNKGNVTKAAREAGKDRRSFGRLIKKYEINRQAFG